MPRRAKRPRRPGPQHRRARLPASTKIRAARPPPPRRRGSDSPALPRVLELQRPARPGRPRTEEGQWTRASRPVCRRKPSGSRSSRGPPSSRDLGFLPQTRPSLQQVLELPPPCPRLFFLQTEPRPVVGQQLLGRLLWLQEGCAEGAGRAGCVHSPRRGTHFHGARRLVPSRAALDLPLDFFICFFNSS